MVAGHNRSYDLVDRVRMIWCIESCHPELACMLLPLLLLLRFMPAVMDRARPTKAENLPSIKADIVGRDEGGGGEVGVGACRGPAGGSREVGGCPAF